MTSMRFGPTLAASALLLSGCSTTLVRVAGPDGGVGWPTIEETIDLGALPIPASGEIGQGHSDSLCTPGEYLALVGANLHGATRVTIGGVPAPVVGYLQGGSILTRVPLGVVPGNLQVAVEAPGGMIGADVVTSVYAYGGDTHEDTIHFRRFDPESPTFEETTMDIELEKARFLELSPDGGMLYAIQKPVFNEIFGVGDKVNTALKVATKVMGGDVKVELLVIHMGGKGSPEVMRRVPVTLSSKPTGMACADGRLVVLQKRRATVFDLSDPLNPRMAGSLAFGEEGADCELIDADFMGNGNQYVAVLEAYANEVHLIDVSNPDDPMGRGAVRLSKSVGEPFSIDMTLTADGMTGYVLQGPNLKLAGTRLLNGLKNIGKDLLDFELGDALDTAGETVTKVRMPQQEGLCRAVQFGLVDGALRVGKSIPLPQDLFPFFIISDGKGWLYVSGINRYTFDLSRLELSLDGLVNLIDMLSEWVELGRIVKVSEETGRTRIKKRGVAIYYDMAMLPTGRLMVSTIRLGPGYLPPRVSLEWGFEIDKDFVELREIANSTTALTDALKKLMPPYDYERIGVQR